MRIDPIRLMRWGTGAGLPDEMPISDTEPDPGPIGPGSVTWRLHHHQWLILGGARAFLMQAAHPKVAQGAVDHSRYAKDPFGRVFGTVKAMQVLMFGTTNEANAMARSINRMHYSARGVLPESIGRYLAGETYSAMEQSVLLWVHMVAVDSWLTSYKTFVGPLSEAKCEQYWQESWGYARLFGITKATFPTSYVTVQRYLREALASGEIAVGKSAHLVAQTILSPPLPALRKPWW